VQRVSRSLAIGVPIVIVMVMTGVIV